MNHKISDVLAGIICGVPHTGTSVVLDIVRNHPKIECGNEGGLLLYKDPRKFIHGHRHKQYLHFLYDWSICTVDLNYICDTDDWVVAYTRLRERSGRVKDKNSLLIDKRPIYASLLPKILEMVNVPVVVMTRDPRAVIGGYKRRYRTVFNDELLKEHCEQYVHFHEKIELAKKRYPENVIIVRHEELSLNPIAVMSIIFKHFGLDFQSYFMAFSPRKQKREVHGDVITKDYIQDYTSVLSKRERKSILKNTEQYKEGRWNPNDTYEAIR